LEIINETSFLCSNGFRLFSEILIYDIIYLLRLTIKELMFFVNRVVVIFQISHLLHKENSESILNLFLFHDFLYQQHQLDKDDE